MWKRIIDREAVMGCIDHFARNLYTFSKDFCLEVFCSGHMAKNIETVLRATGRNKRGQALFNSSS
jgi:hypothetical protein